MANGTYKAMLDFIHRENLDRFQSRLAQATDDNVRGALQKMINDEIVAHEQRTRLEASRNS